MYSFSSSDSDDSGIEEYRRSISSVIELTVSQCVIPEPNTVYNVSFIGKIIAVGITPPISNPLPQLVRTNLDSI